jgi:hypothetical protein
MLGRAKWRSSSSSFAHPAARLSLSSRGKSTNRLMHWSDEHDRLSAEQVALHERPPARLSDADSSAPTKCTSAPSRSIRLVVRLFRGDNDCNRGSPTQPDVTGFRRQLAGDSFPRRPSNFFPKFQL